MRGNNHFCDVGLLALLHRTYGVAKKTLARVCGVHPRSAGWYVDGISGCGKMNADKMMSALGVTLDELEGRITDERLLEVVNLIQTAQPTAYTPFGKEQMLDQSKWTERTCRLCGSQYRVGSLTTCGDCIWASYQQYSPQEHIIR